MKTNKGLNPKPIILITAGPAREPIDPVRYISNYSSGKMGYAVAAAFLEKGYHVVLVSGPVNLTLTHPELTIIPVNSADEMFNACQFWFPSVRIAVFAAAVADYRATQIFNHKMKKSADEFDLRMIKNVDSAYEFGQIKNDGQVAIGLRWKQMTKSKTL